MHTPLRQAGQEYVTPETLDTAIQLHQAGRLQEAELCYRKILEREPDNPDVFHLLGLIAHQSGRQDIAIALIRNAIERKPQSSLFHFNLGNVYRHLQDYENAMQSYLQAVRLQPDYLEAYDRILLLQPDFTEAYLHRGNARLNRRLVPEAIADFGKVLELRPDHAVAWNNMGTALEQSDGRSEEIIAAYQRAIALKPDFFEACNNLGVVYQYQNRYDEAIEQYRRAITFNPDFEEAHFNLSLVLLVTGQFAEGWKEYEWRTRKQDWQTTGAHSFSIPRWKGEPFAGRELFVYDEQGMGDTLQFVRYLPMVRELGGKVVLETAAPLVDLLKGAGVADEIVCRPFASDPNTRFDYHVPLLSLPQLFQTDPAAIPAEIPYLKASPEKAAHWRSRIDPSRFSVGIVWAGKPSHRNDRNRSCPLETFYPLLTMEGIQVIGLQKGEAAAQAAGLSLPTDFQNVGPALDSFEDTAGMIENLDLMITVDTSVAHLAGAMGRPVWLLVPFSPDWRWLLDRNDTPWYPTMRLFRQTEPGDWGAVFRKVKKELKILL